ncbi:MAG TPA: hypothetical protein VGA80_15665, partial [Flavobacteriaceae bacterium]
MNYLDTERTRYQNQDRYATSPEASGQETRAFRPDSWFLSLGSLYNQIIKTLHPSSPDNYRDIGELFRLKPTEYQ